MNLKIKLFGFLAVCIALSCGTLGGIGPTFYFPTSKLKLDKSFSKLYNEHPYYIIPANLKKYDTWSERGYDFLEGRILYFKSPPEEIYYLTYIGDPTDLIDTARIAIAIRAVFFPNKPTKWLLGDDLSLEEKDRITRRFKDGIISKLEKYTNTKVYKED
jgi:hypothetical protein